MLNLMNGTGKATAPSGFSAKPWYETGVFALSGNQASLALDFPNNRYAVNQEQEPFGDVFDYTRSTTDTQINASGAIEQIAIDAPKFDYVTGRRGFAIDGAATNTWNNNTNLTAGSNVSTNITEVDSGIASPFAGYNFYELEATADDACRVRGSQVDRLAGDTHTQHAIFKKGSANGFLAMAFTSVFAYAKIDLDTGEIDSTGGVADDISAKIEYVFPDGSVWVSLTCTLTANSRIWGLVGVWGDSVDKFNYPGAQVGDTVLVALPQFEKGSFATSQIPTTGSNVSRAAAIVGINGAEFSNWYNDDASTIAATFKIDKDATGSSRYLFSVDDGSSSNRFEAYIESTNELAVVIVSGGSVAGVISTQQVLPHGEHKVALSMQEDELIVYVDGDRIGSSASLAMPNVDRINIGSDRFNGNYLNDTLRSLVYFGSVLDEDDVRTLSLETSTLEYYVEGDSYSAGYSGDNLGGAIVSDGYYIANYGVGGSTLEEQATRIEGNPLAGVITLIHLDGSINGHGTLAEDIAKYQRIYDAANGRVVFIAPSLHPTIYNTADGQLTLDLTAAMLLEGWDVVDGAAIARTLSGVSFSDPTDASDAGYNDAAYDALFQADRVHPKTALIDALAAAAIALVV